MHTADAASSSSLLHVNSFLQYPKDKFEQLWATNMANICKLLFASHYFHLPFATLRCILSHAPYESRLESHSAPMEGTHPYRFSTCKPHLFQ